MKRRNGCGVSLKIKSAFKQELEEQVLNLGDALSETTKVNHVASLQESFSTELGKKKECTKRCVKLKQLLPGSSRRSTTSKKWRFNWMNFR